MGDSDFPTVMANGGGKPFLDSYIKRKQIYEQEGTNIPITYPTTKAKNF